MCCAGRHAPTFVTRPDTGSVIVVSAATSHRPLHAETIARVRREFAPECVELALAYLGCYGTAAWHAERDRVHASILDVAQGDLDRLMAAIENADVDYRAALRAKKSPS